MHVGHFAGPSPNGGNSWTKGPPGGLLLLSQVTLLGPPYKSHPPQYPGHKVALGKAMRGTLQGMKKRLQLSPGKATPGKGPPAQMPWRLPKAATSCCRAASLVLMAEYHALSPSVLEKEGWGVTDRALRHVKLQHPPVVRKGQSLPHPPVPAAVNSLLCSHPQGSMIR